MLQELNNTFSMDSSASGRRRNLEASQAPSREHDIYLLRFLSLPVTYQMVTYVSAFTNAIVEDVLPSLDPKSKTKDGLPDLEHFILHIVRNVNITAPVLMITVIYLARLREAMPIQAHAIPGTAHRLFLAALMISSKFNNDTCPKNRSWSSVTNGLFDIDEVNLMERQFLYLIDFNLMFDEGQAMYHFQPILEVMGASLRDAGLYQRWQAEHNVKTIVQQEDLMAPTTSTSQPEQLQNRYKATIEDSVRAGTRQIALRRVARASQERAARLPHPTSDSIAPPAPVLVAPPRTTTRHSPTVSRTAFRPPVISSSSSQSIIDKNQDPKRLSLILARAPSSDSVVSSNSGLTADEGTSSSSSSSMTSEEEAQSEDDCVVQVVASLQIDDDDYPQADMTGVGANGFTDKKKLYGALQQQAGVAAGPRRPSRFGWTRRRSETLKSGDSPSINRPYQASPDYFASSRRHSSRSKFTSSTSTIVGAAPGYETNTAIYANDFPSIGAAPVNKHSSTATIVQTRSRGTSFGSMGIPITTASASAGGKAQQRDRVTSSGSASGFAPKASGGMSISASIRSFLTGGGNTSERERVTSGSTIGPGRF